MFLVNSRSPLVTAASFRSGRKGLHVQEAHLLPKLRCHFAEFLHPSYLNALGFSPCPPVLVWGTVPYYLKLRGFSWEHGISHFASLEARHHVSALRPRICLGTPPTCLNRDNRYPDDLAFSVTPSQ